MVVGAGPAGIAAALALRRAGIEPLVLERSRALGEVGSALTLWPNAIAALEALGASEAVRAASAQCDGIALRTDTGEVLDATSGAEMKGSFGSSGYALTRAELLAALEGELGAEAVRLEARCTGFREDADGLVAVMADGTEHAADLVLGADGIRSTIRAQLFGETPLRYSGYAVWRGVTRFDLDDRVGTTTLGRAAQFGFFPLAGGRAYWFAALVVPAGSRLPGQRHRPELLARLRSWHAPIPALVAATAEEEISVTDVYDRPPLRRWSVGPVGLAGEAAHPSTPNLGQGACQALEDAAVLGACVREADDLAGALREYTRRRRDRANGISAQARRLAQVGRWESRVACRLRTELMRRMPERARVRQLERLFAFDAAPARPPARNPEEVAQLPS